MRPTLVILAAGMASRYGSAKQFVGVGPGDSTIMDYTVYDAQRAGFGRIVFVLNPKAAPSMGPALQERYGSALDVTWVEQKLTDVPAGIAVPESRVKPWGTGHAVLTAASVVSEPFGVANADDFYGQASHAELGKFLAEASGEKSPVFAIVGFRLRDTLSDHGTVSRGVCESTADGWLERITEVFSLERHGDDARHTNDRGETVTLPGDRPVSMNLWGFTPALFDGLRTAFHEFAGRPELLEKGELHLPAVVQTMLSHQQARVRVLPTVSDWCGLTHQDDRPKVEAFLRAAVERGEYPEKMWG